MPGFDGTGPLGRGSMTGRGFGKCRPVYQADRQPIVYSGENQPKMTNEQVIDYQQPIQGQPPVYGLGRGGIPCGGGRRNAFGGRGGQRGRCCR